MPGRRAIPVAFGLLALAGGAAAMTVRTAPVAAAESPPTVQDFLIEGALEQGGWIRGKAPPRTVRLRMGNTALPIDAEGRFFAAFDRDAAAATELVATLRDGSAFAVPVNIAPRSWQIERIDVARTAGAPSESFMQRRRPELDRIAAARAADSVSDGWTQRFIWPVKGRISGRFGSQRIYRGEPAAYHSGIDIATGESGTPFVAPADGVVTLAATSPFSLEGYLLIIDHGNGLNSAFLHCSAIVVREGDTVRQGQHVGNIGATGRATGPHLHWSMKWRDARLDPVLFTGPMG